MKIMPCIVAESLNKHFSSDSHNCMMLQALYPQLTREKIKTESVKNDLPRAGQPASAGPSLRPRFTSQSPGIILIMWVLIAVTSARSSGLRMNSVDDARVFLKYNRSLGQNACYLLNTHG